MPMFSRQAALVLALSFAIAACAQPPAAPVTNTTLPASPRRVADAPAAPPTKEVPAMSEPVSAEPEQGPAIPVAELRKRIVDLFGSFQSLKDLERAHVEQVLQVQLQRDPEMTEGYNHEAPTTEGWPYSVSVDKLYGLDEPSIILIGLDHGVEPWTDQQPTYCTLEFEPLAKELVAMGYERSARISTRGNKPSWGFGRESKANNASFGIAIYIYELEAVNGTKKTCIKSFHIAGGAIDG